MRERQQGLRDVVVKAKYKFPEEEYLIVSMPYTEKAEYKDCLRVNGFWMDYLGHMNSLRPMEIYRA